MFCSQYSKIETSWAIGCDDLNNPPNSFIFRSATGAKNLPTGLGGNSCIVVQQSPGNINYTAQLAFNFNSNKIALRRKLTDGWLDWAYFIASSISQVIIKQFGTNATQVQANGIATVEIPITVPSGYALVDICRAWVTHSSCFVCDAYLSNNNAVCTIRNLLNVEVPVASCFVTILYRAVG